MARFLFWNGPEQPGELGWRRGECLALRPDGHNWGVEELKVEKFVRVYVPGLDWRNEHLTRLLEFDDYLPDDYPLLSSDEVINDKKKRVTTRNFTLPASIMDAIEQAGGELEVSKQMVRANMLEQMFDTRLSKLDPARATERMITRRPWRAELDTTDPEV